MDNILKQSQHNQFSLKFKAPIVDDMIVDTMNDLTLLNINFNYPHKIVWVKNEETYFFLKTGNGSNINHWIRYAQKLTISLYTPANSYSAGDVVYLNNKIFIALVDILPGENPIDNGDKWETISGDINTVRLMINNLSSMIFYTNIKNPVFNIYEGTFEFNNGTPVMDSEGLIKINNQEETDAEIKRRSDLPNNNGTAWEVKFLENNILTSFTGIINIK